MKKIFIIPLFVLLFTSAAAQEIKITVTAPERVEPGEIFRVAYRVLGDPEGEPRLTFVKPDGLEIVRGPSKSSELFSKVVAGVETREESVTFLYELKAERARVYNLPKLTVKVEGKDHTSEPASITVRAGSRNDTAAEPRDKPNLFDEFFGSPDPVPANASSGAGHDPSEIGAQPLVGVVITGPDPDYTVSFVLFYNGQLISAEQTRAHDFAGFTFENITPDGDRQPLPSEVVNGVSYDKLILQQFRLKPERTGELFVGESAFSVTLRQEADNVYRDKKYLVLSPRRAISVDEIIPEQDEFFIGVEVSDSGSDYTLFYVLHLPGELASSDISHTPFFRGGTVEDITGDSIQKFPPYDFDGVMYNRYLLKKYRVIPESRGEHNTIGEAYFLIRTKGEDDISGRETSRPYYVKAPETVVYIPDPVTKMGVWPAVDRDNGDNSPGEMSRFFTRVVPYILLPVLLLITVVYLRKIGKRMNIREADRGGKEANPPANGNLWHVPYVFGIGLILLAIILLSSAGA